MGKYARRKLNKQRHPALEEILSDDYNDSIVSTESSNNNSTASTESSNINSIASTELSNINSTASTGSSNINSTVVTANVTLGDDDKNTDYHQQSNVWKYATKLGPDKASCNKCNAGEYFQNTT